MNYRALAIQSAITLVFLEIAAFVVNRSGLIPDIYAAQGVTQPVHIENQGRKWRTEEKDWGAWHKENFVDRHVKTCFDVTYTSNNLGARDTVDYPIANKSSRAIIALGDSFIEGYGLSNSDTFTRRLSQYANIPVYNLGTANNVGPLQYNLIYNEFKQLLPHDTVIIGFLPSNDFVDNDSRMMDKYGKRRYRPYYDIRDSGKNYPVHYAEGAQRKADLKGSKNNGPTLGMRLNISRLFKNVRMLTSNRSLEESRKEGALESSYYSASNQQQDAAVHFILRTYNQAKEIGVRRFIVLGIPRKDDYKYIGNEVHSRSLAPWEEKLIAFSNSHRDFIYIDGFQARPANERSASTDYADLFLECDGHWSAKGADANAYLVSRLLGNY